MDGHHTHAHDAESAQPLGRNRRDRLPHLLGWSLRGGCSRVNAGQVALNGCGAFKLAADTVHAGGGFSCTADVGAGFLQGCQQGEGVRWDTDTLLPSTM